MAVYRFPGPLGAQEDNEPTTFSSVAGYPPGPVASDVRSSHLLARQRFTTDRQLLWLAKHVRLSPVAHMTVFYAEDEGVRRATEFVRANAGYTRLDELLAQTLEGRMLWSALSQTARPWSDKEEVWWELSHRLANAAVGVVHVFGPLRLVEDRPIEAFKHKHKVVSRGRERAAYANTVFEKVEWPELEQNDNVTTVYYNGEPYGEE
jgi:hypothetical protein